MEGLWAALSVNIDKRKTNIKSSELILQVSSFFFRYDASWAFQQKKRYLMSEMGLRIHKQQKNLANRSITQLPACMLSSR